MNLQPIDGDYFLTAYFWCTTLILVGGVIWFSLPKKGEPKWKIR